MKGARGEGTDEDRVEGDPEQAEVVLAQASANERGCRCIHLTTELDLGSSITSEFTPAPTPASNARADYLETP